MEDVEPHNLFNYDETNVTDNPGVKKVIVRRGLRRVERKTEHSKQSISVMFCGSATGEYLPPMVVYKARNLYSSWTEGGPDGAVYDVTDSGWYDWRTFQIWFCSVFLLNVGSRPGVKMVIGDNLPSHFSGLVIEEARKHNIRFITMPPNSTHLCQPLDMAVFGPAKRVWRKMLNDWRNETRAKGSIPKSNFPSMLKRLCDNLPPRNIIAGFRATGLFPFDRTQVLKRIPGTSRDPGGNAEVNNVLNDSVMALLRLHCSVATPRRNPNRRGKKIVPGTPITLADISNSSATSTPVHELNQPSSSSSFNALASSRGADDQWICFECAEIWEEGDDRWIVCDNCGKQYHLQCSGVQYLENQYYDLDIEAMNFVKIVRKNNCAVFVFIANTVLL